MRGQDGNTRTRLSFGKGLMATAAGAAVMLAITAAANSTGIGAVFNLGQASRSVPPRP